MQTLKSVFGVARAFVPVLYCGSLLYYFFGVGGSMQGVGTIGLGPTVLGLAVVGLLFCIPLILKLVRIFAAPPSPGSGGRPDGSTGDDEGEADAMIARYMARQSQQAAPNAAAARPARGGDGPARRPGFGRKNTGTR